MSDNRGRDLDYRFPAGVAGALVAAVAVRAWGLGAEPFDVEEVYELVSRTTNLRELADRQDSFPPLTRWLFACWVELFGEGAARWFSVAAGVAAVAATAWLGRLVAGARAGVAAAWMAALSAPHVFTSQSARPYALYLLTGTLALAAAWRLPQRGGARDWFWFAAASWLALATHYYAALLIAVLFALVFLSTNGAGRRRAVAAGALFSLACLPLAYCLQVDRGRPQLDYLTAKFDAEVLAYTYLTLVSGEALGPPMNALREMTPAAGVQAMAPWALPVAATLGVLAWLAARRLPRTDTAWVVVLLIAPPALAAVAALASPTGYTPRYLVWMLPVLLVGVAAAAAGGGRVARVATALFVLLSLLAIGNRRLDPAYRIDGFDRVAAILVGADEGAPILTAPRYFGRAVDYHFGKEHAVTRAPIEPGTPHDWSEELAAVEAAADRHGGPEYWVVVQHFPQDDARRGVRDAWLERLGAKHVERVTWTIDVYRAPTAKLKSRAAVPTVPSGR
ncbi:MAG: glycosyltransferase family 39 protein [Planctomycetota bacterium]